MPQTKRLVLGSAFSWAEVSAVVGEGMKDEVEVVEKRRRKPLGAAAKDALALIAMVMVMMMMMMVMVDRVKGFS